MKSPGEGKNPYLSKAMIINYHQLSLKILSYNPSNQTLNILSV